MLSVFIYVPDWNTYWTVINNLLMAADDRLIMVLFDISTVGIVSHYILFHYWRVSFALTRFMCYLSERSQFHVQSSACVSRRDPRGSVFEPYYEADNAVLWTLNLNSMQDLRSAVVINPVDFASNEHTDLAVCPSLLIGQQVRDQQGQTWHEVEPRH